MTANLYTKLEYNNEEEKMLRETAQALKDLAEAIGKCNSDDYYYKPFVDAADRIEEILDNYGIVD